jgi:hypothetical protein
LVNIQNNKLGHFLCSNVSSLNISSDQTVSVFLKIA